MNDTGTQNALWQRLLLMTIGVGAGLAFWFLFEKLPDLTENKRLILVLASLAFGFFSVFLAALGPLRPVRALGAALALALPTSGLLTLASLRFEDVDVFTESGHGFASYFLLGIIATPFVFAALRPGESWRDYPAIFTHAWEIVLRYTVGGAFTGVVWLVITLSNEVLQIVQIDLIERLLDQEPVPFLITGSALGLGMAVVWELRRMISPDLAIRLLRLLLPVVLAVSLIFLAAVPVNGLSVLFGAFSAAATLLAMAAAGVTLVTITADRSDALAAASPVLAWSARGMALATSLLAALAAWAVAVRVGQYGWTPARLAAALASATALAYGLAYAASVLLGAGWQARIRKVNTALALALATLAALWLSPVLNAERISVRSQVARFETGKTAPDDLDLWALGHEWGRAGEAALAALRAPDSPWRSALSANLDRFTQANNRYQYKRDIESQRLVDRRAELRDALPVRPEGARLPDSFWDPAENSSISRVLNALADGCKRRTPAGAPACVAVLGDFLPTTADEEILFVYRGEYVIETSAVALAPAGESGITLPPSFTREMPEFFLLSGTTTSAGLIDEILAGNFSIKPMPINALFAGDKAIGVRP